MAEQSTGRLTGRTALVTAAAQGIGAAIARALAKDGARVVATDMEAYKLAELGGDDGIVTEPLDVTDCAEIAAAAARLGRIDILVNCAGIVHHGTVLECGERDWEAAWEINVTAAYRTIRAFLPGMLAAGGGSIINIASAISSVKAAPDRFAYGTTKAAMIGLTRSVAADFADRGIRCNAICPSTVDSPALRDRIAAQPNAEAALAEFVARHPIGRLGKPEEVAALVVYLAADESAFMTGQALVIDGGWTL